MHIFPADAEGAHLPIHSTVFLHDSNVASPSSSILVSLVLIRFIVSMFDVGGKETQKVTNLNFRNLIGQKTFSFPLKMMFCRRPFMNDFRQMNKNKGGYY